MDIGFRILENHDFGFLHEVLCCARHQKRRDGNQRLQLKKDGLALRMRDALIRTPETSANRGNAAERHRPPNSAPRCELTQQRKRRWANESR
jgi:hypothetical protein